MPADDFAAEYVDDGKQINEYGPRGNIGQIPTPDLIWGIGFYLGLALRGFGFSLSSLHELFLFHDPIEAGGAGFHLSLL